MAFMNWEEKYSVNNPLMDIQHKRLIEFINQLHAAMKDGHGKEEVGQILQSLANYTKSHFSAEEKYMVSINYSELATHKAIHQNLIEQVTQLINRVESGESLVVMDTMNFLKNWLVKHILQEDMQYSKITESV